MPLAAPRGRVLLADDDPELAQGYRQVLVDAGYRVDTAGTVAEATVLLANHVYDVVVSDIREPAFDGLSLLRSLRESDTETPVALLTATPTVAAAAEAVELGALRYLFKPVTPAVLIQVVAAGVRTRQSGEARRQGLELLRGQDRAMGDRAALESTFERGLAGLWMAMQPILAAPSGAPFGFEALVRTTEPEIPHPGIFLDIAERLGRIRELGRAVTRAVAAQVESAPDGAALFVNLHAADLLEPTLFLTDSPLTQHASRVVLEITERAALEDLRDVVARVERLRDLGYRIAVDDLGAGYAGLTSFALLQPEIVKIDMTLIRDIHLHPVRRQIVSALAGLSRELGMRVVAEGVECLEERDVLLELGCDLLQGFYIGRPDRRFLAGRW